jgi:hypothetical protein
MPKYLFISLLYCLLISLSLSSTYAQGTYSKKREFSAVSLSYDELKSIVNKVRTVIDSANSFDNKADSDIKFVSERLSIDDGQTVITLSDVKDFGRVSNLPLVAYKVSYYYRQPNKPISEVQFNLADYGRDLTIEGIVPEQVDALFALIGNELESRTTLWGGITARLVSVSVGYILLLCIIARLAFKRVEVSWSGIHAFPRPNAPFWYVLLMLLFIASIVIIPWSISFTHFLPGFAIYSGDASFIVRNNALFGFLGLIIAPILFVLELLINRKKSGKETNSEIKERKEEQIEHSIAEQGNQKQEQVKPEDDVKAK